MGFFVGTVVPSKDWGDRVESVMNLKEGGLAAHLVSCAVLSFAMITIMITALAWLNAGIGEFGAMWMFLYPMLLPVGYIAIVLCLPLCIRAAIALTRPQGASAHETV